MLRVRLSVLFSHRDRSKIANGFSRSLVRGVCLGKKKITLDLRVFGYVNPKTFGLPKAGNSISEKGTLVLQSLVEAIA